MNLQVEGWSSGSQRAQDPLNKKEYALDHKGILDMIFNGMFLIQGVLGSLGFCLGPKLGNPSPNP